MLESAQQTKEINLDYEINHQWFSLVYIILFSFVEHKFADLAYKTPPDNLITDY